MIYALGNSFDVGMWVSLDDELLPLMVGCLMVLVSMMHLVVVCRLVLMSLLHWGGRRGGCL